MPGVVNNITWSIQTQPFSQSRQRVYNCRLFFFSLYNFSLHRICLFYFSVLKLLSQFQVQISNFDSDSGFHFLVAEAGVFGNPFTSRLK